MSVSIRPARVTDKASIVPWTSDTFSWGDYVPDRFDKWMADDESEVLVCVDEDDTPIGLTHVTMLSEHEGWLEGARVHPEHRRSGVGRALNGAGVEWARKLGAKVMRLATESTNTAARTQVAGLGYREVSSWLTAWFEVSAGHRSPERYRFRPAPASDTEAAWLSWVPSELALAAREMLARGWQWRVARPDDLSTAATAGELFQSPAGWAIVDQPGERTMRTVWLASAPDGLLPFLDGLLDLCSSRDVTELAVKLPELPWTREALSRMGADPGVVLVHALSLI